MWRRSRLEGWLACHSALHRCPRSLVGPSEPLLRSPCRRAGHSSRSHYGRARCRLKSRERYSGRLILAEELLPPLLRCHLGVAALKVGVELAERRDAHTRLRHPLPLHVGGRDVALRLLWLRLSRPLPHT